MHARTPGRAWVERLRRASVLAQLGAPALAGGLVPLVPVQVSASDEAGTAGGGRPAGRPGLRPDDQDLPAGAEPSVTRLVERARDGDTAAFARLYDLYVDDVYRYLLHRVGDRGLAEDLTSETFLRALRRIDRFRWQGRDVGAWFTTIARNLAVDHFRSSRHRLETTAERPGGTDPDPAPGPEGLLLSGVRDAAVAGAVRRLPADQQEVVVLRFLQDLTVAQTARVMGRSDGAIKSLQYRAVRALADLVDGEAVRV